MRACFSLIVMLVGLTFLGGCAGTRATIVGFFTPKEETPEEARQKYEQAKAKYDRDLREYEANQSMNSAWRQGYGFNNQNSDRIRNGEKPVDFFPQGRRPTPPIPPN